MQAGDTFFCGSPCIQYFVRVWFSEPEFHHSSDISSFLKNRRFLCHHSDEKIELLRHFSTHVTRTLFYFVVVQLDWHAFQIWDSVLDDGSIRWSAFFHKIAREMGCWRHACLRQRRVVHCIQGFGLQLFNFLPYKENFNLNLRKTLSDYAQSLRSDKTSQVINKVMTPVSAQKTQTQRKINMLTLFTVNFYYMSGGKWGLSVSVLKQSR